MIEEAIRQSLGDNQDLQPHEESKYEQKAEVHDEEEDKLDFDQLFDSDVFYSCVYNQYCRKPGPPNDNFLTEVSGFLFITE